MQSLRLLSLVLCWSCGGAAPAPADPVPASKAPAPSASPSTVAAEPPPEVGPLPPGVPTPDYPPVALVGYGLRLELNPPFQAARMAGMFGSDSPDVLVVSWWDVGHPHAGKHGRVGLYNVGIVPRPLPEGSPEVRLVVEEAKDGPVRRLQIGETGSTLQLPQHVDGLGGMGTLTVGPATESWGIEVGDAPAVPIPEGELLHSWDPATGESIKFDKMPRQPFGPWPEHAPAALREPAPRKVKAP